MIYAGNSCGIRAGGDAREDGHPAAVFEQTLYYNDKMKLGKGEISVAKCRDLLVSGNIFHAGQQNLCVSSEQFGKNNVYNIVFNNNLYYGPGGSRDLRFTGADTGLVGLNMWKYHTKQDGSSKLADPKFADAALDDFPAAGLPAMISAIRYKPRKAKGIWTGTLESSQSRGLRTYDLYP